MQAMKTIVFQTGGPFHPVEAQVNLIQSWLPSDWKIKPAFGTEAFEQLADADLYVAGWDERRDACLRRIRTGTEQAGEISDGHHWYRRKDNRRRQDRLLGERSLDENIRVRSLAPALD